MTRLISALALLTVFAFSTSFYQQFYVPKLLVMYALGVASCVHLATRRQLFLPSPAALLFLLLFLTISAILGIRPELSITSAMQWLAYLSAALVYLALVDFEIPARERLLKGLFAVSLIQLAVELLQLSPWRDLLPAALMGHDEHLFGTLGNQEFLSALLGTGFFLALHFREHTSRPGQRLLLAAASAGLLGGLAIAHNKGALLFIGTYFLWRHGYRPRVLLVAALVALAVGAIAFPDSIKGRALLWMTAASMFLQHPATGVGLLQFEGHYLDVVHQLFQAHPALADALGRHTAMAVDTHNLFLQLAVELGVAGLVLAIAFARHVVSLARFRHNYLGAALLFLLYKSLYTVVLLSISGLVIFVVLLATLSPRRHGQPWAIPRPAAWMLALPVCTALIAGGHYGLSDYYFQQGSRQLFLGQTAAAHDNLTHAVAINTENADALLGLAQLSSLAGDQEGMSRHIENALHYRRNKDTCKIAANMYYHAHRYDDAFRIYQFLHETFPQHLTSLTKMASIYMLRNDCDNAYITAQAALGATPRQHAESDASNLKLARQIMSACYPLTSPSLKQPVRQAP